MTLQQITDWLQIAGACGIGALRPFRDVQTCFLQAGDIGNSILPYHKTHLLCYNGPGEIF